MSGHSKWSKVKHQKATTDVVKARAFTKASRGITIAVSEGGGVSDPAGNFKLRLALEKAREVNMPKENIKRAIEKAEGASGKGMELFVYEAYGPGGVGMVIEAVTENRQRTVSLIKNVLDHQGGSLATPGAVLYQFVRLGLIVIPKEEGESEDRLFSLAIDAGASDVVSFDDSMELYMPIPSLESVKQFIQQQNKQILTSEIVYRPTLPLPLDDPGIAEEIDALVEKLEELDDVQNVYTSLV